MSDQLIPYVIYFPYETFTEHIFKQCKLSELKKTINQTIFDELEEILSCKNFVTVKNDIVFGVTPEKIKKYWNDSRHYNCGNDLWFTKAYINNEWIDMDPSDEELYQMFKEKENKKQKDDEEDEDDDEDKDEDDKDEDDDEDKDEDKDVAPTTVNVEPVAPVAVKVVRINLAGEVGKKEMEGFIYFRDPENNVYNADTKELLGFWDGNQIVFEEEEETI